MEAVLLIAVTTSCSFVPAQSDYAKGEMSMELPNHPGIVKMVNMFDGSLQEIPIADIPEDKRFVFLKDDLEVTGAEEATEIVPIVEVSMSPLDDQGNLVPMEEASTIRIQEFGPERRPLRLTIMLRDPE